MEQTFIEENRPAKPKAEGLPRANRFVGCFLNRRNQLKLFVCAFAVSVPVLCYYFLFHRQLPVSEAFKTCSVNPTYRVPCGNLNLTNAAKARVDCLRLYCCFDDFVAECFHSLPSAYFYTNENRPSVERSPLETPMDERMYLSFDALDEKSIRVTLSDSDKGGGSFQERPGSVYALERHENRMDIEIVHKETGDVLLTTGLGPLIATENYLEWTFYIGEHLFGLDELYVTGNETVRKVIYHNGDDHTTLPVFMAFRNGSFHSFLIEYGGPAEFIVLPSRLIVFRAIGRRTVSFTLHTGPTPKDIAQFYYTLNGYRKPERWVLQPHICRSGNTTFAAAMEEYRAFEVRNARSPVKYASDCFHEHLYFILLNTKGRFVEPLVEVLGALKSRTRFILSVFPHIPMEGPLYESFSENGLLYLNAETKEPQNGSYFDMEVAYPDYSRVDDSAIKLVEDLIDQMAPAAYSFSGNWASDESNVTIAKMEGFAYAPENITKSLFGTLLWNATTNDVEHIYDHNDYGRHHVRAYNKTRFLSSVFSPGTDTISQVENMNGTWVNLKRTLRVVMSHGIFAHPLVSVPICGSTGHFNVEEQVELCTRWYIMAATMPVFRISSEPPARDPPSLPNLHAQNLALNAIGIRNTLSLYYYSILSRNEPIVRPMFYEFYRNITTFTLDEQYMVGDGLLVAQPFLQASYVQRVYLPPEVGVFYEFFGGRRYVGEDLGWITLTAVPSDWFVFVRGGKIIPLLRDDGTYGLAIALREDVNPEREETVELRAEGFLSLCDEELRFDATGRDVTISNVNAAKECLCRLDQHELPTEFSSFTVYGLEEGVKVISFEGNEKLCDTINDSITIPYGT